MEKSGTNILCPQHCRLPVLSTLSSGTQFQFKKTLEEHFTALALRHLPGSFELSKVTPKLPEPNLKTAVFIQVREPVRGVEVR